MDKHAYLVVTLKIVVAFSGCCRVAALRVGVAEDTVIVEVHESSESEAEKSAAEDEPEDKVVAFTEADGIVDVAPKGNKCVCRRASGDCHRGRCC